MPGPSLLSPVDRAFIRAAVDQFERPLTLYAAKLLGDADSARDVVQDTFLRLCAQPRAEVEPHLAEWLFTVCRNRALDILRKESRMSRTSTDRLEHRPAAGPEPPALAEQRESAEQVTHLLELLPESQQEVIRLRFQNGFSYAEISRISGHSVSNVGYLLHHGIKTLRGRLVDAPASLRTCSAQGDHVHVDQS